MASFLIPNYCIRCNKKAKNLTMVTVMGHTKQKRVGKSNTLTVNYSPTFYLCKGCLSKFYQWIKNESNYNSTTTTVGIGYTGNTSRTTKR